MKLILHVGTEKTGSTYFQEFCYINRDLLMKEGILYPQTLTYKGSWHRYAPFIALREKDLEMISMLNMRNHDKEYIKNHAAKVIEAFIEEVKYYRNICQYCIISSEHLHSRMTEEAAKNLKHILHDIFEDITVYMHLRPQIDLITSFASTAAMCGTVINKEWFLRFDENTNYTNYFRLYKIYADVFGKSNVRVIPYKLIPNFTKFIFTEMGVDRQIERNARDVGGKLNSYLDYRVIAYLNYINSTKKIKEGDILGIQIAAQRLNNMIKKKERVNVGYKDAIIIQNRFKKVNLELVNTLESTQNSLDIRDLDPNYEKYKEKENISLVGSVDTLAELLTIVSSSQDKLL